MHVFCLQVSQETLDTSVVNTAAVAEAAQLAHSQQPQQQQHKQQPQAGGGSSPAQTATAVVSDVLTDSGSTHGCRQGMPCCCAAGQAARGDTALLLPRQGERVSLTIRRVLKVHKALGILGKRWNC